MIKKFKTLILACAALFFASCDKDFVEINTNPYGALRIDPALLFAGAQRTHLGGWETEHTIVQQFVNPFNSGATLGPNFNEDIDNFNNGKWDALYPRVAKKYDPGPGTSGRKQPGESAEYHSNLESPCLYGPRGYPW